MRPIAVGSFRRRVTLQLRSTARDSYGQTIETWTDQGTYWARIMPTRARDILVNNQLKPQVTHTVWLRYLGAMVALGASSHRLLLDGDRVLNIVGPIDVEERHRVYEITCQEN
ncbi:unnamed protein product [uncultured bacterium]|nr:unnamed protein product [uncultured bacterium]